MRLTSEMVMIFLKVEPKRKRVILRNLRILRSTAKPVVLVVNGPISIMYFHISVLFVTYRAGCTRIYRINVAIRANAFIRHGISLHRDSRDSFRLTIS